MSEFYLRFKGSNNEDVVRPMDTLEDAALKAVGVAIALKTDVEILDKNKTFICMTTTKTCIGQEAS